MAGGPCGVLAGFLVLRQAAPEPSAEEVFIADNLEMLGDFELIQRLDLLENWEAIQSMKEQG